MKKIKYFLVLGFVLTMSTVVFLSANVTFASEKALLELSQIESLARGEDDPDGGTCCKDPDEKCVVGSVTVVGHYLYSDVGPCPK